MYSKMARGKMAGRLLREELSDWKSLKDWNVNGYCFNDELSTDDQWIYTGKWRT